MLWYNQTADVLWKSPLLAWQLIKIEHCTLADSPKIVTLLGSPPNKIIFSKIYSSANIYSAPKLKFIELTEILY